MTASTPPAPTPAEASAAPARRRTRSTRRKPRAAASTPGQLKSVRIRMYRQGLGDCFLLTFTNQSAQQHHMLIDCGVLGFTGGEPRVDLAAIDIKKETGQRLHTLVVTHEHADHISGFLSAGEHFRPEKKKNHAEIKPLEVDRVWLAWTENPQDTQTQKIIEKANAIAMGIASSQMGMDAQQASRIQALLKFGGSYLARGYGGVYADPEAIGLGSDQNESFEISKRAVRTMNILRAWAKVDYLEPDFVRDLDGFGVRCYILGPSRKMRMLGGDAPESAASGEGHKLTMMNSFLAAASKNAGLKLLETPQSGWSQNDIDDMCALSLPFDANRGIPLAEARQAFPLDPDADPQKRKVQQEQSTYRDYFRRVYGFDDPETTQTPVNAPEWFGADWRRIDKDWLQVGENLALQYVSTINNTSLVMAIELVESGKVLLFVGDAEQESWDTWHNKNADLDKLLASTVVYKVGHHGSHNATSHEKLAKMVSKELVALIPVDMAAAHNLKDWNFPADDLVTMQPARIEGDKVVEWKLPMRDLNNPAKVGALFVQANQRVIVSCASDCETDGPVYNPRLAWPGKVQPDSSPERLWIDYTLEI